MQSTSNLMFTPTHAASPLKKQIKPVSSPELQPLITGSFQPHFLGLGPAHPMNAWQPNYPDFSVARSQDGNTCDYTLGQLEDTSGIASGMLGTRQWSPLTSTTLYTTKGYQDTPTFSGLVSSHADREIAFLDGSIRSSASAGTQSVMLGPAQLQAVPYLDSGYTSSNGYWQNDSRLGTTLQSSFGYADQLNPSTCFTNSDLPSSSRSINVANVVGDHREARVVLYRPPERTRSARRRCQRATAINIEGVTIDREDLYAGARCGDGMISVHRCQWALSSNPCGMWIVGSRSHVGAHIRAWHNHRHAGNAGQCLWDGCTTTKAMLKDSLNRHVVTVHFGEGFRCHGCNETYSRKDVYDNHVESDEVCRDAGVAIIYSTERGVIDTRRALQQVGDAVRFADL